jgi:glycerol uptake facilitator protein
VPGNDESLPAEFLRTTLLVLFGGGVLANVQLSQAKGRKSGRIVISVGRACGVTLAVDHVNALDAAGSSPADPSVIASSGRFQCSHVPARHPGAEWRRMPAGWWAACWCA